MQQETQKTNDISSKVIPFLLFLTYTPYIESPPPPPTHDTAQHGHSSYEILLLSPHFSHLQLVHPVGRAYDCPHFSQQQWRCSAVPLPPPGYPPALAAAAAGPPPGPEGGTERAVTVLLSVPTVGCWAKVAWARWAVAAPPPPGRELPSQEVAGSATTTGCP